MGPTLSLICATCVRAKSMTVSFCGVKCPWLFHFISFYFCWEAHEARKKGVPSSASLSFPRDLLTGRRWAKALGASVSGAEVSLGEPAVAEQRAESWPGLRSHGRGWGGRLSEGLSSVPAVCYQGAFHPPLFVP